ncbi:craniofacial development protein 2-like [Octopus sinensis]|uniref:Craniofacial development protein 2-like n=1 Tax=Octopus sinensis TaxID=2607531 RepID=A0A6P7TZQ2_9MOLL|nr:craniofacial development protein 2-like [Octopus sinensis]
MGKGLAPYPVSSCCLANSSDKPFTDPSAQIVNNVNPFPTNVRIADSHKIATWNVRGLSSGKLDIVKSEMRRLNIDLLGISEVHWKNNGCFQSDDFVIYYSGNEHMKRNAVAFITSKKFSHFIESHTIISDRIILIHVRGKPLHLTFIQVYCPTTAANDYQINTFYDELQDSLRKTPKNAIIYILGDFNAKVGSLKHNDTVGNFGLGLRNDAGDRLIQFCEENRFRITNTCFQQPKRRLYTWTSPDGKTRNQIDYILCSNRWKSSITAIKTFPGADCGSDHELLVAKIRVRLSRIKHKKHGRNLDLRNIPSAFSAQVEENFKLLDTNGAAPEVLWLSIKSIINTAAEKHLSIKKSDSKCDWLSEDTIKIALCRREAKASGRKKDVVFLNAKFRHAVRKDKNEYWQKCCT